MSIAVLEKAREHGAHMLSGAVLDPSALNELIPDWRERGAPVDVPVQADEVYFLTENRKFRFPITPPPLKNHGNYVISLNQFVKWLAAQAEAAGVDIFTGFAGTEVLFDGERVVGVRTGDRGVDRAGNPKGNFEPGVDIKAKVTIFADGVRGSLTKTLVARLDLDRGRLPQVYAIGIKELWDVPPGRLRPGFVMHTMGYPLRSDEFGGGFIYALADGRLSVGFVAGLDYQNPMFDPHEAFQRFKSHAVVADLLSDGQMLRYGAKALPEGGWHALPRCHMDGGLIVGDASGFVNSLRLKGIHLAMRSGMYAAEAAYNAIQTNDCSREKLSSFTALVEKGPIRAELYPVRNVHQSFNHGLLAGVVFSGVSLLTGGWWFRDPMPTVAGHQRIAPIASSESRGALAVQKPRLNRSVAFDKLTNVHYSGTRHDENQPNHLLVADTDICQDRCREEYGNPCTKFCPANVYEILDVSDDSNSKRLQINASNCVHCKTCDIMDPYQIINWVPPEGGGGPNYEGM